MKKANPAVAECTVHLNRIIDTWRLNPWIIPGFELTCVALALCSYASDEINPSGLTTDHIGESTIKRLIEILESRGLGGPIFASGRSTFMFSHTEHGRKAFLELIEPLVSHRSNTNTY